MASSAVCEFGTEEQAVNHVVLQCPIHRPPHVLHGLTVLDDEAIQWLLNTCPEIQCGLAVDNSNSLKRRRRSDPTIFNLITISAEMMKNHRSYEKLTPNVKNEKSSNLFPKVY